jgi:hypothetical protein
MTTTSTQNVLRRCIAEQARPAAGIDPSTEIGKAYNGRGLAGEPCWTIVLPDPALLAVLPAELVVATTYAYGTPLRTG